MPTWSYSRRDFPGLGLWVPVTYGMKVGLKKPESLDNSSLETARSYAD